MSHYVTRHECGFKVMRTHLVVMCGGASLHLCAYYSEARAHRGPPQPTGRRESPPPVAKESAETLSATLIKHENTISWLINRGKTPASTSQHKTQALQKHVCKSEKSCKNIHIAAFIISQPLLG